MPVPLLSRDEVIKRLLQVFQTHGYEGTSLSQLSRATGLGKSSLYHYFPGGKEDMAEAVLDRVRAWMCEQVITPLQSDASPQERLTTVLAQLGSFHDMGKKPCVLAHLAMGDTAGRFQEPISQAFVLLQAGLERLAKDAGATPQQAVERAEMALVMLEGGLILGRALNDEAFFFRTAQRLSAVLLGQPLAL